MHLFEDIFGVLQKFQLLKDERRLNEGQEVDSIGIYWDFPVWHIHYFQKWELIVSEEVWGRVIWIMSVTCQQVMLHTAVKSEMSASDAIGSSPV